MGKKKDKMTDEFKVGDKVICTRENGWGYYKVGKVYTILEESVNFNQYYTYEHPTASIQPKDMILDTPLARLL
jgi:hypothetical protein